MTLRYLLDTNAISRLSAPIPNPRVVEAVRSHQGELATAAPVWHELLFGCRRMPPSRRRTEIERFLTETVLTFLPILPYDEAAATWHADQRARLTSIGRTPPFLDGQIAAIAMVNDLVLVTANTIDFRGFDGLQLENWEI